MLKLITWILTLGLFMPSHSKGDGLRLEVRQEGSGLNVVLVNDSRDYVKICSAFVPGSAEIKRSDLVLLVKNSEGKLFPIIPGGSGILINEQYTLLLRPGNIFGRRIEVEQIAFRYALSAGIYTLQAHYKNWFSDKPVPPVFVSNEIKFEVTAEDIERRIKRLRDQEALWAQPGKTKQ